eukprot:gene33048-39978_t
MRKQEIIDLCSESGGSGDEESIVEQGRLGEGLCAEGNRWQPFYLTSVCGVNSTDNADALSFQDLVYQDDKCVLEEACFMNYMMDIPWMLSLCPFLATCKTLFIHGSTVDQLRYPDWIISKADMGMERYGTHHSKIMLLFYSTGVRVVITTANFIPEDFTFRTQASYVQDFPLKEASGQPSCEFEHSLVDYLNQVAVSERAQQRLKTICQRLHTYEFKSAQVVLVASVPGRHTTHKDKWGLGKLCKELAKADPQGTRWTNYKLLMQCSSLGSMGPEGRLLLDYARRMTSPLLSKKSSTEDFELVWPTVECVRTSLQGYASGNSLPCNSKTLFRPDGKTLLPGFADHLYQWDGSVSGRQRATPHMKCYFRYALKDCRVHLSWFLLTSCNMSQAAFGVFQTGDSQLYIKSYEMGVLYLPDLLKNAHRTFSCTPSHPVLGRTQGKASSSSSRSGVSGRKTEFVVSNHTEEGHDALYVGFPIPFVVPPEPYGKEDAPWVWDRGFTAPDVLGKRKMLA